MSTQSLPETVKEVIQKSEARTRAQFIANRKEVLIKKWWDEFSAETDTPFEVLHAQWIIEARFGILSQPYTIPSDDDCCNALNDTACTFERFNNYFQENLKRY